MGDIQHRPGFAGPYVNSSVIATQSYMFDDDVTGETHVVLKGPHSIDREVYFDLNTLIWMYSCSKSGSIAYCALP